MQSQQTNIFVKCFKEYHRAKYFTYFNIYQKKLNMWGKEIQENLFPLNFLDVVTYLGVASFILHALHFSGWRKKDYQYKKSSSFICQNQKPAKAYMFKSFQQLVPAPGIQFFLGSFLLRKRNSVYIFKWGCIILHKSCNITNIKVIGQIN